MIFILMNKNYMKSRFQNKAIASNRFLEDEFNRETSFLTIAMEATNVRK